jgi:signal transduction histidine kinase
VVFTVSDSGPGIPPEQRALLFERFESRPNGHRRGGAGLGLSLVKSFVELHGGSVTLDDRVENGAALVCRFPTRPDGDDKAAE